MNLSPIALFVYNRLGHTRQTVSALLANMEAKDSDLYIFSDAPRNDSALQEVGEVRKYIKQITGFRNITIIERDSNWGLANSIIDGVTQLCNKSGRIIVLEDDLVVSPNFLAYMNEGLNKYINDEKLMQIAGYMFPIDTDLKGDAVLLPFISSWGWATWQRAWKHYDPAASAYKQLSLDSKLKRRFDLDGNYKYFRMLQAQQEGRMESWAIKWYLSVFFQNGLVLYPTKTLVSNNGFDGSGVNCAVSTIVEKAIDVNFRVNTLPENIEISTEYYKVIKNMPVPKLSIASIVKRIKARIMGK